MGEHFSGSIHFGVVADEDFIYEHYDPMNLEADSEWADYETPGEAFETHVERLSEGTNLHAVRVGHYEDDGSPWLLALKEPHVENGYSDDYYAMPFEPPRLDVGLPEKHQEAVQIAAKLGLDWTQAKWLLCWSVG